MVILVIIVSCINNHGVMNSYKKKCLASPSPCTQNNPNQNKKELSQKSSSFGNSSLRMIPKRSRPILLTNTNKQSLSSNLIWFWCGQSCIMTVANRSRLVRVHNMKPRLVSLVVLQMTLSLPQLRKCSHAQSVTTCFQMENHARILIATPLSAASATVIL